MAGWFGVCGRRWRECVDFMAGFTHAFSVQERKWLIVGTVKSRITTSSSLASPRGQVSGSWAWVELHLQKDHSLPPALAQPYLSGLTVQKPKLPFPSTCPPHPTPPSSQTYTFLHLRVPRMLSLVPHPTPPASSKFSVFL